MAEPYALVDDEELMLYLMVYEMLERQYKALKKNPQLVFMDSFWDDEARLALTTIAPVLADFSEKGAFISLVDELVFIENVPEMVESVRFAAESSAGTLIKNINSTTQNQVVNLIDASIAENWSLDELTEQLLNLPGSPFGEQRSRLIAVSETTNSYIQGADYAADHLRNNGYEATLIWHTVRDSAVCEICDSRDGQPQGSNWTDPKGAHPGCRCLVTTESRKL